MWMANWREASIAPRVPVSVNWHAHGMASFMSDQTTNRKLGSRTFMRSRGWTVARLDFLAVAVTLRIVRIF